ncbi:MAG: YebC/PmpR family DNA-binding transcriptional regulator [Myxococcota bacterium]|jgi:YebC/PmpR family DNA-binding regulatory protein|nr:YebC/PmpR family DNA-binding transcriptional regulator [Myxococcota bacterium]
MSGHNKWSTIKHKKGKADAARGKVFTKIIREIVVAAKQGGGDPDANPRLRKALLGAKSANMPKNTWERAIAKGTGELSGVVYEDITYEGYGPGGVAILVESLTDNRNRTIGEVRHAFSKYNGNMASPGAVAYLFTLTGQIQVERGELSEDDLMMVALEAGAEDIEGQGNDWTITTSAADVYEVRDALEAGGVVIVDAKAAQVASLTVELTGNQARGAIRLIERLEELDDVQHVWSNFDIDDETAAELAAD